MTDDPIYIKTSISIDYRQLEILADNSYKLSVVHLQQSYLTDVDRIECLKNADLAITSCLNVKDLLRENIYPDDKIKRYFDKSNNPILVQKIKICLEKQDFREALESLERSKARVLAERINERNQEKYKHITFEEIKILVNDYTAILEWFIFDKDCFGVFIVLPKEDRPKLILYTERNLQMLESWADTYSKTYYNQRSEWEDKLKQRLTNLSSILQLQTIIRDYLPDKITNLILIPHRYLHLFPLHILPVDNQFLCEKYTVSYAPSCQLLQQAQKRQRPNFFHLFAIANPTKNSYLLELQAANIRQGFKSNTFLKRDNANKQAILNDQLSLANCVHFGCHGEFKPDAPLESALILANKERLTLLEILNLDLNQCRLVTLSACETGLTETSTTDEYIGLSSGFLLAGSRSIVSSLWEVDQLASTLLLIRFYENIKTLSTVAALNEAQQWLRNLTSEKLEALLEDLQPQIDQICEQLPPAERRRFVNAPQNGALNRKPFPFAAPHYWAAFTAIGV